MGGLNLGAAKTIEVRGRKLKKERRWEEKAVHRTNAREDLAKWY